MNQSIPLNYCLLGNSFTLQTTSIIHFFFFFKFYFNFLKKDDNLKKQLIKKIPCDVTISIIHEN